jgi:hypothetical protein
LSQKTRYNQELLVEAGELNRVPASWNQSPETPDSPTKSSGSGAFSDGNSVPENAAKDSKKTLKTGPGPVGETMPADGP